MNTVTKRDDRKSVERQERPYLTPEVNIFQTQEAYIVEAEMPGVSKSGLEITLEGHELTIIGHREEEKIPGQPLYRESRSADFRRVFELDPVIDTNKISAKMEQGILTLTLPKQEKVKPKKITIS